MNPLLDRISQENRKSLLEDTLPFWLENSIDHEYGGYQFHLDREGSVYDSDKPVWLHGRFVWLLATLYQNLEHREEWLNAALHGADFLTKHGFDTDGRMFFLLDQSGNPLRKRRYVFSEVFAVMGYSALAEITHAPAHTKAASQAFATLFQHAMGHTRTDAKWIEDTRPMKGLALPMAALKAAQEFRRINQSEMADELTKWCIDEIGQHFYKPELSAVLETVSTSGSFIDSQEGRLLCPGHTFEAGWFILEEAIQQGFRKDLIKLGCEIIDSSWHWGWDEAYGGILYYRDVLNRPCTEYWHDMKFWWPHNEAMIATYLAARLTGEKRYFEQLELVHDWAMAHFPDPAHGEWYGYLHRDGRLSTPVKGSRWKGPFHFPRMQYYLGWRIEALMKTEEPQL